MQSVEMPASDLETEIKVAVQSQWDTKGIPTVLAMLGGRLSEKAKAELRVTNQPLAKYIRHRMSDSIRLVTANSGADLAAPVSETSALNDSELEQVYLNGRAPSNASRPTVRFKSAVWNSFLHPISDVRRFVELSENGEARAHDVAKGEKPHERWLEVESADLPPFDAETGKASWAAIATSIRAWAENKKVPLDDLQVSEKVAVSAVRAEVSGSDLPIVALAKALRGLDAGQLARISIPADVILTLSRIKP